MTAAGAQQLNEVVFSCKIFVLHNFGNVLQADYFLWLTLKGEQPHASLELLSVFAAAIINEDRFEIALIVLRLVK